ncbi:hypothetical protein GUITHDRAFT_145889 [Guillardia theta CCMP2712]|uniref:J domain-containing protein n=1 Tax=Guillardia theta (strain CCMP2712) TaxID=905079 RepID=L1IK91_GUITC|nr:hypothetical protein GUITHDRAFT_145889 [Guillardia theta CCMP2712]EKX36324.1 hypothetical protein GUITHDRAFT_145889 [Guillardia theta CCMP2712]|eukprot:XP_005823304.1 hypothetical protein GUITHDRAFT_145889 [Guillardia theta CCMP2712]
MPFSLLPLLLPLLLLLHGLDEVPRYSMRNVHISQDPFLVLHIDLHLRTRTRKYSMAVKLYTEALKQKPSLIAVLANRGAANLALGRFQEAATDCLTFIDDPNNHVCMPERICAAKALLGLGRSEQARIQFAIVSEEAKSSGLVWEKENIQDALKMAREGIKHVQDYDIEVKRAFGFLHGQRDKFYLPIVGRWRSWRKDNFEDQVPLREHSDNFRHSEGERKHRKVLSIVSEAFKCTQKLQALSIAPQAVEPIVLQAWALMIAGNITKILEFCGEKMFPVQDQTGSASTLPVASELWVVYSRALHLAGRLEEAKRILNSGIQSGAACQELCADGKIGPMSSPLTDRDRDRLVCGCPYMNIVLTHVRCIAEGKYARAVEELNRGLSIDPYNSLHCAQLLARRGEAYFAQGALHSAMKDANKVMRFLSGRETGSYILSDINKMPAWAGSYQILAEAALRMKNLEQAMQNITLALKICSHEQRAVLEPKYNEIKLQIEREEAARMKEFAGFRSEKTSDEAKDTKQESQGTPGQQGSKKPGATHSSYTDKKERDKWSSYRGANAADWTKARMEQEYNEAYRHFVKDQKTHGWGIPPKGFVPPQPKAKEEEKPRSHFGTWDWSDWKGWAHTDRPRAGPSSPPRQESGDSGAKRARTFSAAKPQSKGFYAVLGVDVQASSSDIKKTYMRLALQFHPDKYKGKDPKAAEERFKSITRAYEVLSDARSRKQHDEDIGVGDILDMSASFSFRR